MIYRNLLKFIFIVVFFVLLNISCGIDEFYFMPQVSEGWIERNSNTDAKISLPSINQTYASGYRIFYRIYLSDDNGGTFPDNTNFNSSFNSDYNSLLRFIDPTNTTSVPSVNTFSDSRYYEIDYSISTSGGLVSIIFPTAQREFPMISINNGTETRILRSPVVTDMLELSPENSSNPVHERFFRNTSGLNNNSNATSSVNADTASGSSGNAYVSMYIVAVGQNPQSFARLYGKPAFINVFKLPNAF